jgi:hypothetical protein
LQLQKRKDYARAGSPSCSEISSLSQLQLHTNIAVSNNQTHQIRLSSIKAAFRIRALTQRCSTAMSGSLGLQPSVHSTFAERRCSPTAQLRHCQLAGRAQRCSLRAAGALLPRGARLGMTKATAQQAEAPSAQQGSPQPVSMRGRYTISSVTCQTAILGTGLNHFTAPGMRTLLVVCLR